MTQADVEHLIPSGVEIGLTLTNVDLSSELWPGAVSMQGTSSAGGLDKEHAALSGSVSAEGIDNEKQAEKPCPRNHGQGF